MDLKAKKQQHKSSRAAKGSKNVYTYHEIDDRDECNLFMCIAASVIGLVGGIILQMTPIYLPSVLKGSFALKNTLFYKVIFTLVAVGLMLNGIFSIFRKGITRMWTGNGVFTGMGGAFVMGLGMGLCRSDPLLLWVQLATLTKSAIFTVIGALGAAASWGFLYDLIPHEKMRLRPQYFDGICKGKVPFFLIAMPLSCVFAAVVFVLEKTGLSYKEEGPAIFKASMVFSPYFVGLALAFLQLPLVIFFCKSLQGFCSWIACVAFPVNQAGRCCKAKLPGFVRYTGSLSASWSILMGVGVFFGSIAAGAFNMKNAYMVEEGGNVVASMIGGFLMILGSIYSGADAFSLAAGMTNLHIPSYLNFGCMMAGAFIAGRFL